MRQWMHMCRLYASFMLNWHRLLYDCNVFCFFGLMLSRGWTVDVLQLLLLRGSIIGRQRYLGLECDSFVRYLFVQSQPQNTRPPPPPPRFTVRVECWSLQQWVCQTGSQQGIRVRPLKCTSVCIPRSATNAVPSLGDPLTTSVTVSLSHVHTFLSVNTETTPQVKSSH